MTPRVSAADAGRLLLKAPSIDDRSALPFVSRLVPLESLGNQQKAAASRVIRRSVAELPTTLWPLEGMQQRQDLLRAIDEMGMHGRGGSAPDLLPSREARLAIRQRAKLEEILEIQRAPS